MLKTAMVAVICLAPVVSTAAEPGVLPANFKTAGGLLLVEWATFTLGGGMVHGTKVNADATVALFTISQEHWYLTLAEGGVFVHERGRFFVGGRVGYQHFIGAGWALRAGVKVGWSVWHVPNECSVPAGADISPHIQFIRFFKHGSVGFSVDVPILIHSASMGGTNCIGCRDPEKVFPGIMGSLRLSAF